MPETEWGDSSPENEFGARLRALRKEHGLTLEDLAKRLKKDYDLRVDPSAIARLEKGDRSIRLNEAVKISSSLQMTIDEMLRPVLTPEEQVTLAEQLLQRAKYRALSALVEREAADERLRRLQERIAAEEASTNGEHPEAT